MARSDEQTGPERFGDGLALSGGGFRASLFNLGSLWRLNELGWLRRLRRISSVSGGSITSGVLATRWHELVFAGDVATNFVDVVVEPIARFTRLTIDLPAGLHVLLKPFTSAADGLRWEYDQELFAGRTLAQLPEPGGGHAPEFEFCATNYQTGVGFRFSRDSMHDAVLGSTPVGDVTVAQAVAASSAFPPLFSPLVLRFDPAAWTPGPYDYDIEDIDKCRARVLLADGGVYENLGLEAIWKDCATVLVSDAGKPFKRKHRVSRLWPAQLSRVRDIGMEQTLAVRKRFLISEFEREPGQRKFSGAYWGIATEIDNYALPSAMTVDSQRTRALRRIRTRLAPFDPHEQQSLINWGYALADTAIRKHVCPGAAPSGTWPYARHAL